MGKTIERLDEKLDTEKEARMKSEENCRTLGGRAMESERSAVAAEGDMRIEREWRLALQEAMMIDRDKISELNLEVVALEKVKKENQHLQNDLETLKVQFADAQTALEEVGGALFSDKLRVAELLEAAQGGNGGHETADDVFVKNGNKKAGWANDSQAAKCTACEKEFNLTRRKHHCRRCGDIFCGACSEGSVALEGRSRPVRVCDACRIIMSTP